MAEELLYESDNSRVYLRTGGDGGRPLVVKVLNQEFPSPRSIRQFYNEFEMVEGLDVAGVREVLDMGKVGNRHALTLEYVPGSTVKEISQEGPWEMGRFLRAAVQAARILADVHARQIVHKDISALNWIVDPEDGSLTLIDFGISSRIDLKEQHLGNPERLEGNLSYISPEQTGRMNRTVDFRSDLYSLGITFWEMLTGRLPFREPDAMALVHAHIARDPPPVEEVRPDVPSTVSRLVARLLAKNAEDRYQSTAGLQADLERCLAAWDASGAVPDFELGADDVSGRFRIPERLYGRDQDLTRLLAAFDRAARGTLETVLVGGYSGTGKSALVREIHKPITRQRGYFIEGKFDQFQRATPYHAIIEAFKELVTLLLTENEEKLAGFRGAIQEAVGEEGKVLTDVLPRLELIIGEQPDVAEVGGNEAQNRFNYVFRKFVTAISTEEHPIVLFIDDLQWADSASLHLLRVLLTDPENRFLLCVCAYRDNEVSPSHPFMVTVGQIERDGGRLERIEIGNLSRDDVHALVSDALTAPPHETRELTDLVYHRTRGNAFFVTQFLRSLAEEELLYFDVDTRTWAWDVERIAAKNITDNVVELMAGKIQKLPDASQAVLKHGACVGNVFDLETLSVILERPADQVKEDLLVALSEGLVIPFEDRIKFAHDRIQQAVYSLIPGDDRNALHLRIGRLLLADASEAQLEESLFDVVNQLNRGRELVGDAGERARLTELNLRAGRKAKLSSAFVPAYEYLETGIGLLGEAPWSEQYELTLDLHTEAAEVAYNNAEFEAMEAKLDTIFEHARELGDTIEPYAIRINAFKAQNKLQDAIDTGLEVLEQLGERFPRRPVTPLVMLDLVKTKLMLRGKDNDTLASLPVMTDPEKKAAMRMLNDIASPAYWGRPEILPFVIFRMIQLTLRHGVTEVSAFGFPTYGLLMCAVLGDMPEGYRFGQLGLRLLDRFDAKEWLSQSYTPVYALINHWSEHVHLSLEPFLYSYRIGFETGAIEYACVNLNIYVIHSYLGGKPLGPMEEETHSYAELMRRYKQDTNFNYTEVYRQAMLNLREPGLEDPALLTGDAYDERAMMERARENQDKTGRFQIHFNKTILHYLFHQYDEARSHADEARPLLDSVLAKFEVPNLWFYEAMAYMALARREGARRVPRRARKTIRQFRKWAHHSPDNHRHKLRLLEAEAATLDGDGLKAQDAYEEAIAGAAEQEFLHEEALACERAGMHYLERGREELAQHYLMRAYQGWREWGAAAKQDHLTRVFPRFVTARERSTVPVLSTEGTTAGSTVSDGSVLDLNTLLKASTAISGEIQLASLLRTLMAIVVENAGAQRGLLLLDDGDGLKLQGERTVDGAVEVLQDEPVAGSDRVVEAAVALAARTRETLVVDDATEDERFAADPLVQRRGVRSLLCMPIVGQGELRGVLYLEHGRVGGAFTDERTEMLRLLSGQIAISIDNALNYENLERLVLERTREVVEQKDRAEDALERLKATQTQLVQSEKMASLGQLTAGIAHEIKNPLNFVNNFAQLSNDLTDELEEELVGHGSRDEMQAILGELRTNASQIRKHGVRAAAIVRAMEEHAQTGRGVKEATDLNSVVARFARLALDDVNGQGPPVELVEDFSDDVGAVSISVQEIGRVVMNLVDNAVEAVRARDVAEGGDVAGRVEIRTRREADRIQVDVVDNGVGIPPEDGGRVFEPFFTTKDSIEGHTGLGLSLCYDIVTQGHAGTLSLLETDPGGSTFRMELPAG